MKTLGEIKVEITKEFADSLNPKSKFYQEDLLKFKEALKTQNDRKTLERQLSNLLCLNGKVESHKKYIERQIKRLSAAGLFDVSAK